MLDVIGHRADRRDELQALVEQKAAQVKDTGESVYLILTNPFECRVCRDAAIVLGLYSEFERVALNRYVVLSPDEVDDDDVDYEVTDVGSDS